MLRRLEHGERGFTLIELLVVVLIIGILAGIAIAVFLGQQDKARDADAKSNARNLVSEVESCFAREEDYRHCQSAAALGPTGMSLGNATGQVTVVATAPHEYAISSYSTSGSTYVIAKDLGTGATQSCTPTAKGGCPASGNW